MGEDFLGDRRHALEESFFAKRNKDLLSQYREKIESRARRQALAAASGIRDEELLTQLDESGVKAETLAAVTLVPLIAVAWADGKIQDAERSAILAAAHSNGIEKDTPAYELLQQSLNEAPSDKLKATWQEFVKAVVSSYGAEQLAKFKADIFSRARAVAKAAGGVRGLVSSVSSAEGDVLDELEEAFG